MLIMLALLACGVDSATVQSQTIQVAQPQVHLPQIQTQLASMAVAPAARSVVALPSGAATVRNCGNSPVSHRPTPKPTQNNYPPPPAAPMGNPPTSRPAQAPRQEQVSAPIPMNAPAMKSPPATTLPTSTPPKDRAQLRETGSTSVVPASRGGKGDMGGLGMRGVGKGGGGATPDEPADQSAAASSEAAESAEPRLASGAEGENSPDTRKKNKPKRNSSDAFIGGLISAKAGDGPAQEPTPGDWAVEVLQQPTERLDWGATVHLSNDDSMSLASAQRLLWSAMNGQRPSASEIRPHELLNYFSFDTAPVAAGETFSVLGAAEREGDTLTLALAVQGAVPERQPLDLTVAIDRSGSMAAEGRMSYTKRGLRQMFGQLQAGDRLDLVYFAGSVCTPLEDYVVGRDNPALLEDALTALVPRGSTDLDAGLMESYRLQTEHSAAQTAGRNRRVMLITDAELNTGTINPAVVAQVGKQLESAGVRLTGIGVGRDFRDDVLDRLTETGKGAYVYLGSEAVVDRVFGAGFDSLVRTLAHDVRFSLDLPPSLAMTRFYGEEASTDAADIQPVNYYAGTSQVFLQDLRAADGPLVLTDPLVMRLSWTDAVTGEPDSVELHTTLGALMDGNKRNVHKAKALMAWSDWTRAWADYGTGYACGEAMDVYADRTVNLQDDAEVGFLSGLTANICGRQVVARSMVPVKVRVDSDIPISAVTLSCGGQVQQDSLGGADTVARFDSVRSGQCVVILQGNVQMSSYVEVASTGGDLRCSVRAGRVSCG